MSEGPASTRRPTPAIDAGSYLGSLLRPVVLLLISEAPAHGYGLVERLGELGVAPKRAAGLYRELRNLEDQGLLSSIWDVSQTRGPARRLYRVTPAGRRELKSLMPVVAVVADALVEAVARHDAMKVAPRARKHAARTAAAMPRGPSAEPPSRRR